MRNYCDICINKGQTDPDFCTLCEMTEDFEFPTHFQMKPTISATAAMDDPVNHPNHYQTKSGLETIQVIEAFTDRLEGIEAVCTANVIKYICRWKKKNGLQDLKKARWYLGYLIAYVEKSAEDAERVKVEAVKNNREATLKRLKAALDPVFDAWERWPDELMDYHGDIVDFLKEKNKEEKETK